MAAEVDTMQVSDVVDITAKFQGVLTEELSPIQSTLQETNKSMAGLSNRFNDVESMLSTLCKTVDVLQVQIRSDDVRPRTSDDSQPSRPQQQSPTNMSNHEQALVSQLVARIEHLSQDVTTFDSTRQLKEDNLLLRKDLQAYQERERHFLNRMETLEKKLQDIQDRSNRPQSSYRRGSSCGAASPEQVDFPPISNGSRSKSNQDLAVAKSRSTSKDQSLPRTSVKQEEHKDQVAPMVRKQLVSPSRTKKAASILRRSSSSSSSCSNESVAGPSRSKQQPITAKFQVDSLQSEIQIARSDNSILRQDIQVYRHRENQLYSRAIELEETITQQNKMLIKGRGKSDAKSEVQLNIDFVSGNTPQGTKAIVTAVDNKNKKGQSQRSSSGERLEPQAPRSTSKSTERQPSLTRNSNSRDRSKDRKSTSNSDDERASQRSSMSDAENIKTLEPEVAKVKAGAKGKAAASGPAKSKAAAKPGAAASRQSSNVSSKKASDVEHDSDAEKKGPPSGWQNSILEGEDWKVTISSKHELATSSDTPNKTVIITPKIPEKVEEKKEVKQAVAKTKEKRVVAAAKKSREIPAPPQYPCTRPPKEYVEPRPYGWPMVLDRNSNIAIVAPLPKSLGTTPLSNRNSFENIDQCGVYQMYIKQEPIDYDVNSGRPMPICHVSYDSIYDDPYYY